MPRWCCTFPSRQVPVAAHLSSAPIGPAQSLCPLPTCRMPGSTAKNLGMDRNRVSADLSRVDCTYIFAQVYITAQHAQAHFTWAEGGRFPALPQPTCLPDDDHIHCHPISFFFWRHSAVCCRSLVIRMVIHVNNISCTNVQRYDRLQQRTLLSFLFR